jgi:hypothetical protein
MSVRMTLGVWLGGAVLFGFGFGAGRSTHHIGSTLSSSPQSLVSVNEEIEILQFGEQKIRLLDLPSHARFNLHRMIDQLVTQAYRHAEEAAAKLNYGANTGDASGKDWRHLFSTKINRDNLLKIYDKTSSFRQSGAFSDVWSDVERFVIDHERGRVVGEFLEKNSGLDKIRYQDSRNSIASSPFDVSKYPLIFFGETNKPETPEVVVLFRYSGRLSQAAFKYLEETAQDSGKRIPVRLVPEDNFAEYDQFAIKSLFSAVRMFDKNPEGVKKIHMTLLNEPVSPKLGQPASDDTLIKGLNQQFMELGLSGQSSVGLPDNHSELSAWYRDVRASRLPMMFVGGIWISDSSPFGLRNALKVALGIKVNSIIGR